MAIIADPGNIIEVNPLFDGSGLTLPSDVKVRYSFNNITYFDGFGGNTSGFTFEVTNGTPIYAKYTYDDNSPVVGETGELLPYVLETVFLDSTKFANTVTLTKTEAVYDFNGPRTNGGGAGATIDKTVSWTIGSNSEIVSGSFLDGSPWVVDNGDIYLISTSPEQTGATFGAVLDNGDGTYSFDYTNEYTKLYDINNTVINPDFGIKRRMNTNRAASNLFSSSASEHYEPNIRISARIPFDARAGVIYTEPYVTNPANVGRFYVDHKWNKLTRKLEPGDTVFVVRSMNLSMNPSGGFDSIEEYADGTLYYWGLPVLTDSVEDYPQFEQICILNVLESEPPANAFRPPANWDPADKLNRPIFTEQDDLSTSLIQEYPNYTYFSNDTPDWVGDDTVNTESLHTGPTDSAVFVTMMDSAFTMRQYFPASQTDRGYGGYESNRIERMIVQAYDSHNSESVRTAARRRVTQQGIDAYGMWKSTGKWDVYTGYHGGHYTPSMIMAWLVCGQPEEIYGILNGDYVGSTASGNYVLSSDWKGFTGFYPASYYHEGNQRYKVNPDYLASNIDYIYNSCNVIESSPGEAEIYGNNSDDIITVSYDQIVDIERIPSIREGSDFDKLTILKNFHNILGYNNNYPGWGVHDNNYYLTPKNLCGLIIKGRIGYGRVIMAAAEDPDTGDFYTRGYDPEFRIVNKIRLFIKGVPTIGSTDSISLFRSSITEAEEGKSFITLTTAGIQSTSAVAMGRDYHYSTQAYQHAAALWANTVGGYENLPFIAKHMYEHSKLHVTNPFYRNSRIGADGYNLGTVIPTNGYYDDPSNVSPRILNGDGSDDLVSALFRKLYFDDPSQSADNPIVIGRKETWPNEALSNYTYPNRSFFTDVKDFYATFGMNYNSNNGSDYYDINGNIIYPNNADGKRNYTQVLDWFPNFGQTELGQDDDRAPDIPQYVVDGVTLDSIVEIRVFDGGIEWQNFLKDKTIYYWMIGGHQPFKFKLIGTEPNPTDLTYTVRYARVDEFDNFLPSVWDFNINFPQGTRTGNWFATNTEI